MDKRLPTSKKDLLTCSCTSYIYLVDRRAMARFEPFSCDAQIKLWKLPPLNSLDLHWDGLCKHQLKWHHQNPTLHKIIKCELSGGEPTDCSFARNFLAYDIPLNTTESRMHRFLCPVEVVQGLRSRFEVGIGVLLQEDTSWAAETLCILGSVVLLVEETAIGWIAEQAGLALELSAYESTGHVRTRD